MSCLKVKIGKISSLSNYAIGRAMKKTLVKIGKIGGVEKGFGGGFVYDLAMVITIVF